MRSLNKSRLKALAIDIAIIFLIWLVTYILFEVFFKTSIHYFIRHQLRIAIVIALFLCKDLINGQSIGKKICKLKVVDNEGKDLSPLKLYLRNFFAFIFFIEIIFLFCSNKRTGDIAFNTKVVPMPDAPRPATSRQIAASIGFFIGSIAVYFLLAFILIRAIKVL